MPESEFTAECTDDRVAVIEYVLRVSIAWASLDIREE